MPTGQPQERPPVAARTTPRRGVARAFLPVPPTRPRRPPPATTACPPTPAATHVCRALLPAFPHARCRTFPFHPDPSTTDPLPYLRCLPRTRTHCPAAAAATFDVVSTATPHPAAALLLPHLALPVDAGWVNMTSLLHARAHSNDIG